MHDPLMEAVFNCENRQEIILKSEQKGITEADIKKACDPEYWQGVYLLLQARQLKFPPEHEVAIPKDERDEQGNMKYRIVKVGESDERIIAPLFNNALFKVFPHCISPYARAYQKGDNCGKVAHDASERLIAYTLLTNRNIIGGKWDFSKFFDNIKREVILKYFDVREAELGFEHETEPVLNCLRDMFNDDHIIDVNGELVEKWSGIRQGMAVSAFLANAILKELDDYMSKKYVYYVRYSDDLIVIGGSVKQITNDINRIVEKYGISLNEKKTKPIKRYEFFKFLGFSISGDGKTISLSDSRIKKFNEAVWRVTIDKRCNGEQAKRNIMRVLYKGSFDSRKNSEFSWATSVLPYINCEEDLKEFTKFLLDNIRCCEIGRWKRSDVGGLGFNTYARNGKGAVVRGKGNAVSTARKRTKKWVNGFYSVKNMKNYMMTDREAYANRVASL